MLLDAHVHIFPPEFISQRERLVKEEPFFALLYADPASVIVSHETMLKHMERDGVNSVWAVGFSWQLEKNARTHNDYLLQVAREYPDKVSSFAACWPMAAWAHDEAKRVLELGASGLGELAFYDQDIDLKHMAPLCGLCAAYNVPLMLHVNEPLGRMYAGKSPMGLSNSFNLLKQNPECNFILSHLGGGIFFYKLLIPRQIENAFDNLWLDTAATPFLYQPQAIKLAVELLGADRILLGCDYPLLPMKRTLTLIQQAELSRAELEMVCSGSALRLLGN